MPISSWSVARLQKDAPFLAYRARIKKEIANFFEGRDFLEVETPALQISPGLEPHLGAFKTLHMPAGAAFGETQTNLIGKVLGQTLYLHTSPEFAMKKLLAGGLERIWQLCKTYRNGEGSSTHHPEFTMLEWYRANPDPSPENADRLVQDLKLDLMGLIRRIASLTPNDKFTYQSLSCDPFEDWQIITVAEAFMQYAGLDLDFLIGANPLAPSSKNIAQAAKDLKIKTNKDDRFEDIFFSIFDQLIEPKLGFPVPSLLVDYPLSMAALARPKTDNPRLAERFEFYICGLELANGFGELNDPVEQRRRFNQDQDLKQALYQCRYPIDEAFLTALKQMPPAAGIALGVDRLIMLASGAKDIKQTLWSYVPDPLD